MEKNQIIKTVVISSVSGLFVSVIFQIILTFGHHHEIITIRPKQILASHLKEFGKNIPAANQDEYGMRFADSLQAVINDLTKDGYVVLVGDAVIAGAQDYSSRIESLIAKKMGKVNEQQK